MKYHGVRSVEKSKRETLHRSLTEIRSALTAILCKTLIESLVEVSFSVIRADDRTE